MTGKSVQVVLRVEPELVERADRIAAQIGAAGGLGVEPSRSAVMRAALNRGLTEMEADQQKKPRKR